MIDSITCALFVLNYYDKVKVIIGIMSKGHVNVSFTNILSFEQETKTVPSPKKATGPPFLKRSSNVIMLVFDSRCIYALGCQSALNYQVLLQHVLLILLLKLLT